MGDAAVERGLNALRKSKKVIVDPENRGSAADRAIIGVSLRCGV